MVISFEEKDRIGITARGIMVIEFKRMLYRTEKGIECILKLARKFIDGFVKVWNVLREVVDSVEMVIETVKDIRQQPTSFRYKAVKFLSKCTGIKMLKLWKMTRHTRLARSCC